MMCEGEYLALEYVLSEFVVPTLKLNWSVSLEN
jgi:hypothetical protein